MLGKAKKVARDVAKLASVPKELIAHFLTGPMSQEAIKTAGVAFKKALIEAKLDHHLGEAAKSSIGEAVRTFSRRGYAAGAERPEGVTNQRNGVTAKTVLTGDGKLRVETPRDRDGSFEPVLIPKHERRFTGFDDKVVALHARGLTVRDPGVPAGNLWHQGQPRLHRHGDGRRAVGDHGVAEPAAGGGLRGGVFRRAVGEDPRGRRRAQQGGVSRARHPARRHA
jgi:putative transposase